jgi:hypothetical protein
VGVHVGAHIEEDITGTERVEHEVRISGFMQAAVEVHGGAGHARLDHQGGATHPGHKHRHAQQAAAQLPAQEAGDGAGQIAAGEEMALPVAEQRSQLADGKKG